MDRYIQIQIGIMMTIHMPFSPVVKQRIEEEISIFCSRLEKLEGYSNHIYLHEQTVEEK